MAYLRISEARAAGQAARSYVSKSASQLLMEDSKKFSSINRYDIFLSHSYQDAEVIYGIKTIVEKQGLKVYVDWLEDPGLDQGRVTARTAQILRERMKSCASLVYVHSSNSKESAWMPWELGYFDGLKFGYVWILPLVSEYDSEFKGQEYLGLYPPIEKLGALAGRVNLGFTDVGAVGSSVLLAKAASGTGIYFTSK